MTSRDQLREQQSGLGTKQRPSRPAAQRLQPQNDATRSTKTCEQGRKAPTGAIDLKHGRSFEEETPTPNSDDLPDEEDGYRESRPGRLPTSSRRYLAHAGQDRRPRQTDNQAQERLQRRRATTMIPPVAKTRRLRSVRFHWLFFVGLGLFIMIIGWLSFSALSSWYSTWQDDLHYGRPRTYQVDHVVGHNDSAAHPTHFIAINLNGQVLVIEIPGGDARKAKIYIAPTLFGAGQDLVPVTLSFVDCDGNGSPDLNIHIQGSDKIICFPNNGKTFDSQSTQHRGSGSHAAPPTSEKTP